MVKSQRPKALTFLSVCEVLDPVNFPLLLISVDPLQGCYPFPWLKLISKLLPHRP